MRGPRVLLTGTIFLILSGVLALGGCGDDAPTAITPTTATLHVDVVGLPDDATPTIDVIGPDDATYVVHGDSTLRGLAPGAHSITAHTDVFGAFAYEAETSTQTLDLVAGTPQTVRISYFGRAALGRLQLDIEGLPSGADAACTVEGPEGATWTATASTLLTELAAGAYTLTASSVVVGATTYLPTPTSEELEIAPGTTAGVFVTYSALDPDAVDLRVTGVELVQSVQRADGSVPLVRDRAALLRVYATSSFAFAPAPDVRVEITVNGDLVWTSTVPATSPTMSTNVDRGDLSRSWNVIVPADAIQPGLEVRATIDPTGLVLESDEANNRYPEDGSRWPVDVVSMGPLALRLVPVRATATGLVGNVDAQNAADFATMAEQLYPFAAIDVDVRATFTTDAPVLQATNGNGAWYDVLRDVLDLRTADGAASTYYYGVVQVDYTAGVAGMGFVSTSATRGPNTAVGWDRAGTRGSVLAHELGHNLGRSHAPCGGPVDTDPSYPYENARVGQWGYDAVAMRLIDPLSAYDIMSYCRPQWISDHNFEEILAFAAPPAAIAAFDASGEQNCVLVSGMVDASGLHLDPVLHVVTRPRVPERPGAYRLRATDAAGHEVLTVSFDPESIGCADDVAPRAFSWALPLSDPRAASLQSVVVEGEGLRAAVVSETISSRESAELPFHLERVGSGRARLTWDAVRHPRVVVRDAGRGQTIAILRSGDAEFEIASTDLVLVLAQGARSTTHVVTLD